MLFEPLQLHNLSLSLSLLSLESCVKNSVQSNISMDPLKSDNTPMSPAERYTLIGWTSITLVCCLIGNTIILLASSRYRAIRLDKTSVVLIKSIAICDLVTGIFTVQSILASLLYGGWPYGTITCYVFSYLKIPSFVFAILLICGLHLSKLHTLLYPLDALGRNSTRGHKISVIVFLLSFCPSLAQIAIDSQDVAFDYRSYMCINLFSSPISQKFSNLFIALFVILPNLIVVGTSIALLRVIKKAEGRVKHGIRTIFYVGLAFIIVNGPMMLHLLFLRNFIHVVSPDVRRFYENNLFRAVSFFAFSNCFLNFFVYYRSVKSFNVFVRKVLKNTRGVF